MLNQRKRLQALLIANKARPKRYEIEQKSEAEATIYLYDTIDPYFGVNAESFVKDLNALKASTIHLRINSPGGDVFDARAIATAIDQHPSTIIAHVDGLAASAASYIAIAADRVEMAPGSFLMIHKAWTFAYGNAEDLTSTAALLDKIDTTLIADYAKKTGASQEKIGAWMAAETWFTSDEAVAEGFADTVTEEESAVENSWDLSVFNNAPARSKEDVDALVEKRVAARLEEMAQLARDQQVDAEHAERIRRFDFLDRIA
jgi:ATP-dependent Clp protease protease subunit